MSVSYAERLKQGSKKEEEEGPRGEVQQVIVDALVALQITRHSEESGGAGVSGMLLGVDEGAVLRVTHSFALPSQGGGGGGDREQEAEEESRTQYQMHMLRCLQDVNVDTYSVGWYLTSAMASHYNEGTVHSQLAYQRNRLLSPNCVSLVYDPLVTQRTGHLSLRALRLTAQAMKVLEAGDLSAQALADLSHEDLFEELPVHVESSPLAQMFLHTQDVHTSHAHLDLASSAFLEKNMELMTACVDDLQNDASRQQYFVKQTQRAQSLAHRRRLENEQRAALDQELLPQDPGYKVAPAPPRLTTLTTAAQANAYVDQANEIANETAVRVFLLAALAKE